MTTLRMKDVIDAIGNRVSLTVGDECFESTLWRGNQTFNHIHPQYPVGRYKCADWIGERIAWLVLHRFRQTEVALAELLGIQHDARMGYRNSVATQAMKVPGFIQQLRSKETELFDRAAISLRGMDWGRLLVDGLWVGATYGRGGPETIESWRRVGRRIEFERYHQLTSEYDTKKVYSREVAQKTLNHWCGVRDGLALDVASGFGVDPLSSALEALAVPSARWYLEKGSRWHRRLLWRVRRNF